MDKLTAFLNSFGSYLVLYLVFIAVIVVAFLLGVATRKAKNKKEAAMEISEAPSAATAKAEE